MKQKYKFFIAIPTRGRTNKQKTLALLHPEIRKLVNVFCHPGEKEALMKLWGDKVNSIQEYDKDCRNLGDVREYILFNSQSENVIYMDDNLRLQSKRPCKNKNLKGNVYEMIPKNYDPEEILEMQIEIFNWFFVSLEKYAMAGLSFRPFNRGIKEDERVNCRIFAFWGINVKSYLSQERRFCQWPIKQDFAIEISLIQKGYDTICNFYYSFDKSTGANSKGGCSDYRTLEAQNNSAIRLQEEFPDVVKIKSKVRKNWSGEFEGVESLDVVINWNKIHKL